MGSPDPNARQLDGMGGGYSSVSKICVVDHAESERADVDVGFTFVQIGVKDSMIDFAGNCGNMTSAIGPYAVENGLPYSVDDDGNACVRILNTNTNKVIHSSFPLETPTDEDELPLLPDYDGSFAIDGVAGTASRIKLDFINPGGSKTGKLLPTGNATDTLTDIAGLKDGRITASMVDCGNPCVYVRAEDMQLSDGTTMETTMLPESIANHPSLLSILEEIRVQGSLTMGLTPTRDAALMQRSIPKVCVVASPPVNPYKLLTGESVTDPSSYDILTRTISTGDPHRAIPITVSLCVAAASRIKRSVVESVLRSEGPPADEKGIVIAHPSGRITVGAEMQTSEDGSVEVKAATIYRTARKLFDGKVYYMA